MQSRLERNAERQPDMPQLSLLDDCHTIGRADACIAAVQDFLAECATANLVDVPEKGKVFSFNAGAAARVATALGYQDYSQTGIKVVGMPVGMGQAAMRAGSRQSICMRPGGQHHGLASIAQAAPAAACARMHPAQIAPLAADT